MFPEEELGDTEQQDDLRHMRPGNLPGEREGARNSEGHLAGTKRRNRGKEPGEKAMPGLVQARSPLARKRDDKWTSKQRGRQNRDDQENVNPNAGRCGDTERQVRQEVRDPASF